MKPKFGDSFFTGFEKDFPINGEYLTIEDVGQIIEYGNNEGNEILASDGIWYDCFWSDKVKHFVYGLE